MGPAAPRPQTVLLAMLVDMDPEGVLRVSALVTVPLVGTPQQRVLRARRRTTAFCALLVDMVQAVALRVSALVIVLPVGTPPKRLVRVQQ